MEVQNNQTSLSFLDHFSTLLYLSPKKKNACIHVAILRLNIDKYRPYFWSVTYYDRKLYGFKCPKMTQDSVPESRNAISFSRSFVRLDDYSLSIIDWWVCKYVLVIKNDKFLTMQNTNRNAYRPFDFFIKVFRYYLFTS